MKNVIKYMSGLALAGLLTIALSGSVYAQRGGHRGGGGGFHGGGGGFHGGSGFHGVARGGGGFRGGSAFRGGGGFRGNPGAFRGSVGGRGGAPARNYAYRGNVGARNYAYRGGAGVRGGVSARGYAYRGGFGARGYAYRGGRYYGRGGYRGGYYGGSRFRFGFGWGYPHFGLYFSVLPYGYYPFYWNSLPYYYSGGVFYVPYNGGYRVTAPPIGASVPDLPSDAQSILIDGTQYYEANGVYYQPDVDENGRTIYIIVGRDGVLNTENGGGQQPTDSYDPSTDYNGQAGVQNQAPPQVEQQPQGGITLKVGDVVDQLPDDCRKVTINKKKYYVSPDNIFFEEYKDADGTSYRVASIPAPGQTQDNQQ
ncbi:MAG TPA: DUF6515 family protein [Mucilaginibacter sp.]|nr:DUF6515 family protein [Mucilaginibacter sp.]